MSSKDPSNNPPRNPSVSTRDAAANAVRGQIDAIYTGQTGASASPGTPVTSAPTAPQTSASQPQATADHWQQYHSAWQDYYQKYYERYYSGHMQRVLREQQEKQAADTTTQSAQASPSNAPQAAPASNHEAVERLRQKLKTNIKTGAKKAHKSRHFIPVMAAFSVVLVVAFLQYNSILMATVQAYVSPGAIDPQNIVVDPTASTQVGPEPKLIIPKINVDVPVVYGIPYTGNASADNAAQMKGMEGGVIHFAMPGASSVPGQIGNTAISGHSSNDLFEPGNYKFVFAQLDKLEAGDTIYANYQGTRYTYTVTNKEVVKPNEGNKLAYPTDKPILTLITCTPLGTSTNRLLVTAEQVSPDPAKASPAPTDTQSGSGGMPGNSPSALQKLFGAG